MLVDDLKTLLATNFAFYLKTHGFHWNVEGPDFAQLHGFLSDIYNDVFDANDKIAEYIRTLQDYAPASFERFSELSIIPGQTKIPRARLMLEELLSNSGTMIELLNKCFESATQENKQGIANFIAERLDSHEKYAWQIRSFLNDARA